MSSIVKIGHRGAKGHVAENTLESITKALSLGADAIEIDVHRCASGEIVVMHDFTLDRTTNGSGEIARKHFAEISDLRIEQKYKIPLLTEVLDLIEGRCKINIELKGLNTATGTCKIIEEYLNNRNWKYSDFIVSSFQKNELFEVFKQNEEIPIAILSKASVSEAIELGKKLHARFIHPGLGIITRENVK
ncbi:MAG: glycerophosphodiester phosphodiesterase family protein, partial [Gillisia sp.]